MTAQEVIARNCARRYCLASEVDERWPDYLPMAAAILAALDAAGLCVVPRDDVAVVVDDFAAHLDAEYCVASGGPHPAVAHKYDRDMAPVLRLRAMLAAAQEPRAAKPIAPLFGCLADADDAEEIDKILREIS